MHCKWRKNKHPIYWEEEGKHEIRLGLKGASTKTGFSFLILKREVRQMWGNIDIC